MTKWKKREELTPEDHARIAKLREGVKSGKIKIEMASSDGLDQYPEESEQVLNLLGFDDTSQVFISDESSVGDFIHTEKDEAYFETLAKASGLLVKANTTILELCRALRQLKTIH